MTLNELIEELKNLRKDDKSLGDCPVCFKYPSGDYWKTELAPEVDGLEEGETIYSGYHQKPQIYDREERKSSSSTSEQITRVVLLNSF